MLTSFPGLSESLVKKHLPILIATELGHLCQEKQHLQPTAQTAKIDDGYFPPQANKTKDVLFAITTYSEKEVAAADLTGPFPYKSSRGKQYALIMYHHAYNVIWGVPLKRGMQTTRET